MEWGRNLMLYFLFIFLLICLFFVWANFPRTIYWKVCPFPYCSVMLPLLYIMHLGNCFEFILLLWKQPHQRPLYLACEAVATEKEDLRSSSCNINHPVFQEGAKVSDSPQTLIILLPHPDPSLSFNYCDLPYPHSFFLLPSGHFHSHIWCLIQGLPGK